MSEPQDAAAAMQPKPLDEFVQNDELIAQANRHLRCAEAFGRCYRPQAIYAMTPVSVTMALVHATIAQGLIALSDARGGLG